MTPHLPRRLRVGRVPPSEPFEIEHGLVGARERAGPVARRKPAPPAAPSSGIRFAPQTIAAFARSAAHFFMTALCAAAHHQDPRARELTAVARSAINAPVGVMRCTHATLAATSRR
jgi:hypothetical protein